MRRGFAWLVVGVATATGCACPEPRFASAWSPSLDAVDARGAAPASGGNSQDSRTTSTSAPSAASAAPANSFSISFPIWIPGVTGHFAEGSTSVDIDRPDDVPVTNGDKVLTELEFAFVGRVDACLGRTVLYGDGFGIQLRKTADFDVNALDVDASVTALVGRAMVGWRIVQDTHGKDRTAFDLDALAGVRGYYADIELDRPQALAFDSNKAWVDPILGARANVDFSETWNLMGMADIGGFGLGSNMSWSTTVEVSYRISRTVAILLGYSFLSVNTDIGSGANEFVFDLKLRGPELGVTITF